LSQQEQKRKAAKHKQYKKEERKIRTEQVSQIKIDLLVSYDGSADFKAFERWTYSVNSWSKSLPSLDITESDKCYSS
jgi:hypothetical protein